MRFHGQFEQMLFTGNTVTAVLTDDATADATQLWMMVVKSMAGSSVIEACKHANPTPAGEVNVTLALAGRIEATLTGEPANHTVGVCLRRAIDDLVRPVEVPVTKLPAHPFTISLP